MKRIEVLAIAGFIGLAFSIVGCEKNANTDNASTDLEVIREANQSGEREPVAMKVAENGQFKTFTVYSDANAPDNQPTAPATISALLHHSPAKARQSEQPGRDDVWLPQRPAPAARHALRLVHSTLPRRSEALGLPVP